MSHAELFDAWLRNELDAAGKQRLAELLERDEAAAKAFIAYSIETSLLLRAAGKMSVKEPESAKITRRDSARQAIAACRPGARSDPSRIRRPEPVSRRRVRPWSWFRHGFGLVLVMAAMGMGWSIWNGMRSVAVISDVGPGGTLVRGHERIRLQAGMAVREGDLVECAAGPAQGLTRISYRGESTSIDLRPGAVLRISADGGGKRIMLASGSITAEVAHQPSGMPMVITAAEARFTVVGTRLTLNRTPHRVQLGVEDGVVRAAADGDGPSVDASAGSTVFVKPGGDMIVHRLDPSLSRGLVGWWPLDDQGSVAEDASGYGHHGRITGAYSVPGRIGTALSFEKIDHHVNILDAPHLQPGPDGFTLCAWVKVDEPSSCVVRKGPDFTVAFSHNTSIGGPLGTSLQVYIRDGGRGDNPRPRFVLPLMAWRHVAVTVLKDRHGIYVDGKEVETGGDGSEGKRFRANSWVLGDKININPSVPRNVFTGQIDEVRMYDRALSAREIRQLAAP